MRSVMVVLGCTLASCSRTKAPPVPAAAPPVIERLVEHPKEVVVVSAEASGRNWDDYGIHVDEKPPYAHVSLDRLELRNDTERDVIGVTLKASFTDEGRVVHTELITLPGRSRFEVRDADVLLPRGETRVGSMRGCTRAEIHDMRLD